MNKKRLQKTLRKFDRTMQKIVDESKGIDEISIQFGKKPPIVLAKKNKKGAEKC